jgi:hypothetical protein
VQKQGLVPERDPVLKRGPVPERGLVPERDPVLKRGPVQGQGLTLGRGLALELGLELKLGRVRVRRPVREQGLLRNQELALYQGLVPKYGLVRGQGPALERGLVPVQGPAQEQGRQAAIVAAAAGLPARAAKGKVRARGVKDYSRRTNLYLTEHTEAQRKIEFTGMNKITAYNHEKGYIFTLNPVSGFIPSSWFILVKIGSAFDVLCASVRSVRYRFA